MESQIELIMDEEKFLQRIMRDLYPVDIGEYKLRPHHKVRSLCL